MHQSKINSKSNINKPKMLLSVLPMCTTQPLCSLQNTWHASACPCHPATRCPRMLPEHLDLESRILYIMYCSVFIIHTEFSALIEAYIVENKDLISSHHRSSAFLILSACCIQRFAFNRWQDFPKILSSDFGLGFEQNHNQLLKWCSAYFCHLGPYFCLALFLPLTSVKSRYQ